MARTEVAKLQKELNSRKLELIKWEYQVHELKKDCSALEAHAQMLSEQLWDLFHEGGPNTEDSHPWKIPATCCEATSGYPPMAVLALMTMSQQPLPPRVGSSRPPAPVGQVLWVEIKPLVPQRYSWFAMPENLCAPPLSGTVCACAKMLPRNQVVIKTGEQPQ